LIVAPLADTGWIAVLAEPLETRAALLIVRRYAGA
jgi:hypothetical protein